MTDIKSLRATREQGKNLIFEGSLSGHTSFFVITEGVTSAWNNVYELLRYYGFDDEWAVMVHKQGTLRECVLKLNDLKSERL